jgi:large subunit ribosomal protein L2
MKLTLISLPSGKEKLINSFTFASLGKCYNEEFNLTCPGKAGSLLNRGLKSKVRGVAKNPVDHPHGGRTKTNKPEVSPWG